LVLGRFLHDLGTKRALDRFVDTRQWRRGDECVAVAVDAAARAITLLSWRPRVWPWGDVFSVHQDGR